MNPSAINFITDFGRCSLQISDLPELDRMLRARGVFDLNDVAIRHEVTRYAKEQWDAGGSGPFVWRSVWHRPAKAEAA